MLPCVCLFSTTSQRMSKCSKNICDTLDYHTVCPFLFLPHLTSSVIYFYNHSVYFIMLQKIPWPAQLMGRMSVIPSNKQQQLFILIGCIFYHMGEKAYKFPLPVKLFQQQQFPFQTGCLLVLSCMYVYHIRNSPKKVVKDRVLISLQKHRTSTSS